MNICRNCGGEWTHTNSPCPAENKECRKRNKLNHFAKVCRSGNPDIRQSQYHAKQGQRRQNKNNIWPVNTSDNGNQSSSDSSDSEYCYAVKTNAMQSPGTKLKVNIQNVQYTVDTGSTINLIDANPCKQCNRARIRTNQSAPQQVETSKTSQQKDKTTTTFPVTDKTVRNILNKRNKVFQGVEKLKNRQIELIVDKSVKPITHWQRRIPFHLRAKVDSELSRLEQDDIIEKVPDTDETPWISPVVIVPKKDDKIRLCVDMRAANTAIKRVCHPIPTVRDISLD
ncbi:Retrovirus-related Pol poly from transposon [Paramuricea clavata]|uniref:Retrovirus-related Pol poly from transposon n=1 Tax=Paramuricea clavata TaxID=317549 RepID=A0A6S7JJY7_PARCT|nr:Retrovirus-related Pol poly from transposon [Paramuricea clavata]